MAGIAARGGIGFDFCIPSAYWSNEARAMKQSALPGKRQRRPIVNGRGLRLVVAALFAFYVNFVSIHLATEAHLHQPASFGNSAHFHFHGEAPEDHSHDPHDAVQHAMDFAGKSSKTIFVALDLLSPALPIAEDASLRLLLAHRAFDCPGESPPRVGRPRGPPLTC
jgi:hypothetical protein